MNRITAALYRFLVVYLSIAMVVTSIPLAPRAAYADDAGAVAVESEAQETDSGSDTDAVDELSPSDESASSTSSDQTSNTQDDSSNAASDAPGTSLAQDLTSAATDSDAAKSSPATSESSSDDSEVNPLVYEDPTVYEYAKLMPNGYVYPCDASGSVTVEIDGNDPYGSSVDGKLVTNLIVDYGADGVPGYICEYSSNLRSVVLRTALFLQLDYTPFLGAPISPISAFPV